MTDIAISIVAVLAVVCIGALIVSRSFSRLIDEIWPPCHDQHDERQQK